MSGSLRKPATLKRYKRYLKSKSEGCDFCNFSKGDKQFMKQFEHFKIVRNIFGYDWWDSCGIVEQLMLVPNRHLLSFDQFDIEESREFMKLISKYEKDGYSLYARAPGNSRRSIDHQHSHLIKIDNQVKRMMLYTKKPHILWIK